MHDPDQHISPIDITATHQDAQQDPASVPGSRPSRASKSTRKPARTAPDGTEGLVSAVPGLLPGHSPAATSEMANLAIEIENLGTAILQDAETIAAGWESRIDRPDFAAGARNLAQYLALRRRDLRPLQRRLMALGLSSLGRAESRVMPTFDALRRILAAASGGKAPRPFADVGFFDGESTIASRAKALLGSLSGHRPTRLLVTLPSEAADDPAFFVRLVELGVEAVRINCAHDDDVAWAKMIAHVEAAARSSGRRMKVLMDLPGPKIRTGAVRKGKHGSRLLPGDEFAVVRPGLLEQAPKKLPAVECETGAALHAAEPGHLVYLDDGKVAATVLEIRDWGLRLGVDICPEGKGYKLKPEKGLNFPDADVEVPALTDEDRALLPFVAKYADAIEFSFVQTPADVADLQAALAQLRPDDWRELGLVLKVETKRAVRHLPEMLVAAAGQQPTAVMIARGDLAVEIGFARLAEMQEEILWLCEAAHVPVIWATQVMESFLKTGIASRGEMTDAAMATRAECVMLNKGPHLFAGIAMLDRLLGRMGDHMYKKAYLLRSLKSW